MTKGLASWQDLFVSQGTEAKIAEHAVVDTLRKAVWIILELLRIRFIAQIGEFDQNSRHAGAAQYIQTGIEPHAVVLGADAVDDSLQHMLRQPIGLRVLLVNVNLGAVDRGIDVRIAMDADKIIGGPAVSHHDTRGKAGGVARAEDLGWSIAADAHGKARVGAQQVGQILTDRVIDILLAQTISFRAGVWAGRVVACIDENADWQKITSLFQTMRQNQGRIRKTVPVLTRAVCGAMLVAGINLKMEAQDMAGEEEKQTFVEIDQQLVDNIIPRRAPDADKNTFGRVLCVCGSAGYTGAAYFAAQGAVRMGSGVVTLAVPEKAWPVLAVKLNEPVVRPMPCGMDGMLSHEALPVLLTLAERADALLIGCGLGRSDAVTEIVCALVREAQCPVVVDADGINALAAHKDVLRQAKQPVVLTPHAAEFARLSGLKQPDTVDLSAFAVENRCILLYKGHRTRIFAPDGTKYRNHSGNPGMAKGGSGDVLAGMLVALCGQGIEPVQAACAAAWLHGRAGDAAANRLSEYGMTPGDMLCELPRLLHRYNTREW